MGHRISEESTTTDIIKSGIRTKEDYEIYDSLPCSAVVFSVDDDYKIYYLGYSNGALIGAWFGIKYPKIKRMALVNGPLMYNLHKTKEGALSFKGESINFIYGECDQSIGYVELLKSIENDKIKVFIEEGQDHHFSKSEEDFQKIPEKYLFEMNPEK